jgi:K+-sensing histidine kinase KdpD
MSAERDELERTQARIRELESQPVTVEKLSLLASSLEREADSYEVLLVKSERRALAREHTNQTARLMTFGFAMVFVLPIVGMIGVSAGKALRHEPEAAGGMLFLGLVLIIGVVWGRAQAAVVHLVSTNWRLVRQARKAAAAVRGLIADQ